MSTFRLDLNLKGDAFGDMPETEVVRLLRGLAAVIEAEGELRDYPYRLQDINGNRVGFALLGDEPNGFTRGEVVDTKA